MTDDPLIHIGYHKTGTTFLQTGLFRPEHGFSPILSPSETRRLIVLPDDYTFDPARVVDQCQRAVSAAVAADLVPVISDERLSGSPHAGGFDTARIARRLHETFPGGRVLIGIREQRSMIRSVYNQYVRDGGSARIDRYLAPRGEAEVPGPRLDHWKYDRAIGQYQDLFGSESVLVMPVEHLHAAEVDVTTEICGFVGLGPPADPVSGNRYPSLSPSTLALKRQANRWIVRNGLSPGAPFYVKNHEDRFDRLDARISNFLTRPASRADAHASTVVAEAVSGLYGRSNQATERQTGLDLGAIGYELE